MNWQTLDLFLELVCLLADELQRFQTNGMGQHQSLREIRIPWITCLHSIHSEKGALELAKQGAIHPRKEPLPILIEIHLDHEKTKSGLDSQNDTQLLDFCKLFSQISCISLQGLMAIPQPASSNKNVLDSFIRLRELGKKCRPFTQGKLSMGMSDDFQEAIQAGSTHLRLGRCIFEA